MANIFVFFKSLSTAISDSLSILLPVTIFLELMPTLLQTALVTSALSPVRTITRIPALFNFSIETLALSFGGSRKPTNPSNTISFSSDTEK